MALLMSSQGLSLFSGHTLSSAHLPFSSSFSSSESSSSAHLPRGEQSGRGIRIGRSGSVQFSSRVGCRASSGDAAAKTTDGEDRGQWDVSSNCVKPVFRVTPLASDGLKGDKAHILFLSEGNVCRSVYAEAIFSALLRQHGLQDLISCSSKATRDYNVGETADPRAVAVAEEHRLALPEGKVATVFNCSTDIIVSDLVLVMDKFTASDALKEVTVYEIINKHGKYSSKVRRLGEFCQAQQLEDIDDPLYGNIGDEDEMEMVRQIYGQVRDCCEGLIDYMKDLKENLEESESLKEGIARGLGRMDALNWLVPPMLSKV